MKVAPSFGVIWKQVSRRTGRVRPAMEQGMEARVHEHEVRTY